MKNIHLIASLFFIVYHHGFSLSAFAQEKNNDCKKLRSGIFFYYQAPLNGAQVFARDGEFQSEVNVLSGDTSIWKIEWKNDCRYKLTYVKGEGMLETYAQNSPDKITADVEILIVTDDYYTFRTVDNKQNRTLSLSDTIWMKEQSQKLLNNNVVQAKFPGGNEAWNIYWQTAIQKHRKELVKTEDEGICFVRFIVDSNGRTTDVQALTMRGSLAARIAVSVIEDSPPWQPGTVNGILQSMVQVHQIKVAE